ncbi:helix-turn-helix domain-containing protein [Streptomyces sp. cg36]|uniref:PucR family transcriptional regulator n=1 Tax=Streptomyces sp. cg36 TaxID=3238798 RepID=UPI0034E2CAEF
MPNALHTGASGEQLGPIPRELATIMWPELPPLLDEIKAEVLRVYPEYADVFAGPHGRFAHAAIEQSLTIFVDQVVRPSVPSPLRDEMFRTLGRYAALQGRSLDTLRGTFRVGARVALRHTKKVGKRYNLSPVFMLSFADTLFAYMDQLEALASEGYLDAGAAAREDPDELRRKILRLIASGSGTPRATLVELAERAGWQLPEEVSLVALSTGARPARTALHGDMLLDLGDPQPYLLVPGALDTGRRKALVRALGGARAAAGPTVPPSGAADSLRWARQALGLALAGIIEETPVVHTSDHLVTLLLMSDPALLEQLAARELSPLQGQTATRRERLTETLRTWLATRGTAAQIGEVLHIHPQTVRYRMRNLDAAFGRRLTDPDHRFATEIVLRAMHLRERAAARPAVPPPARPRTHVNAPRPARPRPGANADQH